MAGIRGRNTKPEIAVRRHLFARGFRFRIHVKDLPGRPDLVFPRYQVVVFVDGCFWHRHPGCPKAYHPKSRVEFWEDKFNRNVERDQEQRDQLARLGWRVEVVWECEIGPRQLDELALRIRSATLTSRG